MGFCLIAEAQSGRWAPGSTRQRPATRLEDNLPMPRWAHYFGNREELPFVHFAGQKALFKAKGRWRLGGDRQANRRSRHGPTSFRYSARVDCDGGVRQLSARHTFYFEARLQDPHPHVC
jgi:hypothetical protein